MFDGNGKRWNKDELANVSRNVVAWKSLQNMKEGT
jgi:hypothetical protein